MYIKKNKSNNYVWWLKPHLFIYWFVIPIYIFLFNGNFELRYGKNYFDFEYFLLGLSYLCVLGFAAYLGSRKVNNNEPTNFCVKSNPLYMDFLASLTIMAYIIWFWKVFTEPKLLLEVIAGLTMNVRQDVTTIPGLTTLTQLGVVYIILFACYKWIWQKKLKYRYNLYFYIIILLGVVRTVAWSERLATIELILPIALIYLIYNRSNNRLYRLIVLAGPYLGIFIAILFFGFFELFRSWGKQQAISNSLISFMTERFGHYYYTALNNGAGLLSEFSWPNFKFEYTFNWIYSIPGVGPFISQYIRPNNDLATFLENFADTEFTTASGIFPVFYDFGMFGGFIYAAIFGLVVGFCYKQFEKKTGLGLLIYPILFISLTELLRIPYLGQSRVIPILIFIIIGYKVIQDHDNPNGKN